LAQKDSAFILPERSTVKYIESAGMNKICIQEKNYEKNKLGESLILLSSAYFSFGLALANTKIETRGITLQMSVSHVGAIPDVSRKG